MLFTGTRGGATDLKPHRLLPSRAQNYCEHLSFGPSLCSWTRAQSPDSVVKDSFFPHGPVPAMYFDITSFSSQADNTVETSLT